MMEKGLNVLSLFDGMSCGQIALDKANIKVDNYFASEIKSHAIKVTQENYPSTKQLGDIHKIHIVNSGIEVDQESSVRVLGYIPDLVIGGSPCQDISNLKPSENINGSKSKLFYEYLRILNEVKLVNPNVKFLLENVNGDKESIEIISSLLGVPPIRINSNLVSFQNRDRLYWTNIEGVTIPEDKKVSFQDYILPENDYTKKFKVNRTPSRELMWGNGVNGKCPNVTNREKVNCLTVKQDRWSNAGLVEFEDFCRYLTTQELELAQTIPLGYTSCLTKNQSEDVLGDGWTIDVVSHIFSFLKVD